jgi:hypothetical protein
MSNGFESIQNMGKDNVDLAMKSVGVVTKGFQAIAAETADYGKRSLEASAAVFEKLAAAKSVDVATKVQSEFVRSAYEGYVGQVTTFGEIVADMAKEVAQPYQSIFGKFGK